MSVRCRTIITHLSVLSAVTAIAVAVALSDTNDAGHELGVEHTEAAVITTGPGAGQPYINTGHDTFPDFCADVTVRSARAGNWTDPNTWAGASVPDANDVVSIEHPVIFEAAAGRADCVGIRAGASLTFLRTAITKLTAGNIIVYSGGALVAGSVGSPVTGKSEIVIADKPLNLTGSLPGRVDPEQFGTALIAFGKVEMHGRSMSDTFVRVAEEPVAGATHIVLSKAVTGWQIGDRIQIPDTRQLTAAEWGSDPNARNRFIPRTESGFITAISTTGNTTTVTLNAPLRYDHPGAREVNSTAIRYLPHVMNMTRNVIVRSENPAGTRGHVLFTGRADVDVRYVAFQKLGRTKNDPLNNTVITNGAVQRIGTNQIGRYSVHLHHLKGPVTPPANGYQFTLVGNAVDQDSGTGALMPTKWKWGITVHGSHYGLVKDNVVYNTFGAGINTEDGSESFNVFERNMVMRVNGSGSRGDDRGYADLGHDGVGFWFRGQHNYVRDNVATTIYNHTTSNSAFGFKYFGVFANKVRIPRWQGADPYVAGQYIEEDLHKLPALQFERNEVYGAQSALTVWWIGAYAHSTDFGAHWSVFRNTVAWHVMGGMTQYEMARIVFDGFTMLNKVMYGSPNGGVWGGQDYVAHDIMLRNFDVQGTRSGFDPSVNANGGRVWMENSFFWSNVGIPFESLWINGGSAANIGPRIMFMRNVRFGDGTQLTGFGNSATPVKVISMDHRYVPEGYAGDIINLVAKDELCVYNHNGVVGDSFQAYYDAQRADGCIIKTTLQGGEVRVNACPQADTGGTVQCVKQNGSTINGMNNQECLNRFGVATAGAIAPCMTMRTDVKNGFACPLSSSCPIAFQNPNVPFIQPVVYAPEVSNVATDSATIAWLSDVPVRSRVQYAPEGGNPVTMPLDDGTSRAHATDLINLQPGQLYTFQVFAVSATGGVLSRSYPYSFRTRSLTGGGQQSSSSVTSFSSSVASSSSSSSLASQLCATLRLQRRLALGQNHALSSVNVIVKSHTGLILVNTSPNPSLSSTGMLVVPAAQLSRVRDDTTTQYTVEVRPSGHMPITSVRAGIRRSCFDLGVATTGDFDGSSSIAIGDIVRFIAFYNGNPDAVLSDVFRAPVGIADIVAIIANYQASSGS